MEVLTYSKNDGINLATRCFILLIMISTRVLATTSTEKRIKFIELSNESIQNLSSLYYDQRLFLDNIRAEKQLELDNLFSKTIGNLQRMANFSKDSKDCTDFVTHNIVINATLAAVNKNLKCLSDVIFEFEAFMYSNIMLNELVDGFPNCYRQEFTQYQVLKCLDNEEKSQKTIIPYNKFVHLLTNHKSSMNISMNTCIENFEDPLEKSLVIGQDIIAACVVQHVNKNLEMEDVIEATSMIAKNPIVVRKLNSSYKLKKDVLKTMEIKNWQIIQSVKWKAISESAKNSTLYESKGKNISCCLEHFHNKIYEAADKASIRDHTYIEHELFALYNLTLRLIQNDNIRIPFDDCFGKNLSSIEILPCIDRLVMNKTDRVKDIYKNVTKDFIKNINSLIISSANNALRESSVILNEAVGNASMQFTKCCTDFKQILIELRSGNRNFTNNCVDPSLLAFLSNDDVDRFRIKI